MEPEVDYTKYFNCQICGKQIITAEGQDPCEHTAWMYLSLVSEFIVLDDKIKPVVEKLEEQGVDNIVESLISEMKGSIDHYQWSDFGADSCGMHEVTVDIGIYKQ